MAKTAIKSFVRSPCHECPVTRIKSTNEAESTFLFGFANQILHHFTVDKPGETLRFLTKVTSLFRNYCAENGQQRDFHLCTTRSYNFSSIKKKNVFAGGAPRVHTGGARPRLSARPSIRSQQNITLPMRKRVLDDLPLLDEDFKLFSLQPIPLTAFL